MDLSVLIPARNEEWLARTVADVLEHAQGATEVIVVLDGEWPAAPLPQHPRLTVLYHPRSVGQRAATNEAARVATGRFVMKLDAHCSVSPGFDVELVRTADAHPRETLWVPAQKNLHVFDWICKADGCGWRDYQGPRPKACPKCKGEALDREVVWKPRKGTTATAWRFDATLHFQYWGAYRDRAPQVAPGVTPTLSLLGACWMADRAWYLDGLEGLDERHGSWGQMGTELGCKAWLSGGQVLVNHRAWFAHLFRTRDGFGFPYPLTGREQDAARTYSRGLWLTDGWSRQVRTLRSLLEQFWPVDGWRQADLEALSPTLRRSEPAATDPVAAAQVAPPARLPLGLDPRDTAEVSPSPAAPSRSAGVIYYSDNRGDLALLRAVRRHLRKAAGELPIVAVTLPGEGPLHDDSFDGMEHVVLPLERGYVTMARQILAALRLLDTEWVHFAEHDVLYTPDHFGQAPAAAKAYAYNVNVWKVDAATGRALHYTCEQLSGLSGPRALLLDHFTRRVAHLEAHGFSRRLGFEPGKPIRHGGLDDIPRVQWGSARPIVDIRHAHNLTPSRWRREEFRNQRYTEGWTEADAVPGWGQTAGRFSEWLAEVTR